MTMMPYFIRPFWLYLLIPALLYFIGVMFASRQTNPWKKVCDAHLLPALIQASPTISRRIFHTTLFLFFVTSIFALSGPAWKKTQLPIYRDVSSIMLVLDLSPAMQLDDLKPDRLSRAKFKIRDLINAAQNTQMGLVVFTNEAFVASPLSKDANTLDALLDELNPQMMPVAGSDMSQGLTQGLTLLKQAGVANGNLLLITASEPSAASWAAAKSIAQVGGHLNVLAMVDSNATTKDIISQLRQLATMGDGSFYLFTPDSTDIQNILTSNQSHHAIKDENIENAYVWQDAGPWFCLLLIPLALLVLREKVRYEKP